MAALIWAVLVVAVTVIAVVWGRTLIRTRPNHAAARVLREVDDRVLWIGITTGMLLDAVYYTAQAVAPWTTWSWVDAILKPVVTSPDTPAVVAWPLGITILAVIVLVPVVVVRFLPPSILALTMAAALWRARFTPNTTSSTLRMLILPTGLMMLGAPVAAAIPLGIATYIITRHTGRAAYRVPEAEHQRQHGDIAWRNRRKPDDLLLTKVWDDLGPVPQHAATRTAATLVVVVFTYAAGMSLVSLLTL